MKNKYLLHFVSAVLFWSTFSLSLYSQTTTQNLGVVKNGKITLTDLQQAERILKVGLSANAVVSEISIGFAPLEKKYYLLGTVSNDPVSGKALQLQQNGGVLYASTGPGVEVTCVGFNCSQCMPDIKGWKPKCVCHDSSHAADMRCDMISKITIGF